MALALEFSMHVEGLAELDTALGELPKATGKNVIRRALTKAGQPIVDMAVQLAPVGPPRPGELKNSITVSRIKFTGGSAGKQAFAQAMSEGATRADARAAAIAANAADTGDDPGLTSAVMVIGPGRMPQAYMQEFGTINHGPQPYMRPAWDANKIAALELIKSELWNEIQKAAARLARKAARQAAST